MSLPLETLDDRRFADLFEEVRALLPRLAPEWTDHNTSDPGITLLELSAWLVETQLQRLDRTPARQYEAWARLFGLERREAEPARVRLWPSDAQPAGSGLLPAGRPVWPAQRADLPFETARDRFLTRAVLRGVTVHAGGSADEHLETNRREHTRFFALGRRPRPGDRLELRFAPGFAEPIGTLWFELADEGLPAPNPERAGDPQPCSGVQLAWEFSRDALEWRALAVLEDETRGLTRTGALVFRVPPGLGDECRLRARVSAGSYEIAPDLWCVDVNVLDCRQVGTLAPIDLGVGTGEVDQAVDLAQRLPEVQARAARDLWLPGPLARGFGAARVVAWPRFLMRLGASTDPLARHLAQALRSRAAPLDETQPPTPARVLELALALEHELAGQPLLRAVREDEQLALTLLAHARTPGELDLPRLEACARAQLARLFPEEIESDEPAVRSHEIWTRVATLADSGPADAHFVLDRERLRIGFGNGVNGRVPGEGEALSLVRVRTCRGASGNAESAQRWSVAPDRNTRWSYESFLPARGGRERETITELLARLRAALRVSERAVTAPDVEALARATPGLRVARAHVLFGASTARPPASDVPGDVLLTVVPGARAEERLRPPDPSEGFRASVERHLARHRLLGDRIRVRSVRYVDVAVACRLVLVDGADADRAVARAGAELDRRLAPLAPDGASAGEREIGRDVRAWELRAALDELDEVDYVDELRLVGSDGVAREEIVLRPGELPRPGRHKVDVRPAVIERDWRAEETG